MAPDAPASAPYSLWQVNNTNGSADGNPHRNVVTETHHLTAGRYEVRVTRESASRASTYAIRLSGAIAP